MSDSDVFQIVEALADGEPVDWSSVRARQTDPASRRSIDDLHLLSRISRTGLDTGCDALPLTPEPLATRLLLGASWLLIAAGIVGMVQFQSLSIITTFRLLAIVAFAIAAVPLRRAAHDPRARDLGAVFVLSALAFSRNAYIPLASHWIGAGPVLRVLCTGVPFDAWLPLFLWRFARRFPATLRFTALDRAATALISVSAWTGAILFVFCLSTSITGATTGLPYRLSLAAHEGQGFSSVLYLLMLPTLPVIIARARAASREERGRVNLFAGAMAAGFAPVLLEVICEAIVPGYADYLRATPAAHTAIVVGAITPLLAIPIVTTYAVLVHRLLEARVVMAVGARYALGKAALTGLTIVPSALFVSRVYQHRQDSVVLLLTGGEGPVLFGLAVAGAALLGTRGPLLRRFDRWFDRRHGDKARALAAAAESLRFCRTRSELARAIEDAARTAMNAEAVVHFHDRPNDVYVPFGRGGATLSGDSAIGTVAGREPGLYVLRAGQSQPLFRLLPAIERLWLEQFDSCAVAAIHAGEPQERPAALISFGPRRDSAVFTADEERFVAALTASASIAAENLRLRTEADGDPPGDELGVLCVRCGHVHAPAARLACPLCGGALRTAAVPQYINRKFRVDAVLGSGGMGVVYRATDSSLGRQVALKTLPSLSAGALRRLGDEARTMAALSHGNLATIYGTEVWRGTTILVCEYLSGGTLKTRLAAGPMPAAEVVAMALTLLGGLEYMHQRGVLHSDIKPSNIGFSADGTPKLLDFGLAGLAEGGPRRVDAPWVKSGIHGTLAYLSPEAVNGATPSVDRDLWALSVTLFESMTGQHPFLAGVDTVDNIRACRIDWTLDPIGRHPGIAAFLQAALSLDAAARPASASEFRQMLSAASADPAPHSTSLA